MNKSIETHRKGGKYKGLGFLLILLGILGLFWNTTFGGVTMFIGFIVFIIGRFM